MKFEVYTFMIGRIKLYLISLLIVLITFVFLIRSEATWKSERKEGYCRPKNKVQYPWIPYMPAVTKQQSDATLFTFIEKYLHWSLNETITDFHRPSNLSRRATAYLQAPLLNAVNTSKGEAKANNMKKYKDSQNTYIRLKNCNCGYIFNINAIEQIIKTNYSNIFHVTVLGEFQLTGDKQYSNENHSLWGFKRVWLTIVVDKQKLGVKGREINPYGYYVTFQETEDLDYYYKDALMKKVYLDGFMVP